MAAVVLEKRVKEEAEKEIPKEVKEVVNVIKLLDKLAGTSMKVKKTPSSIMLQVLKYGKTFKRVIETVKIDYSKFEKLYHETIPKIGKVVTLYKTSYRHAWKGSSPVPPNEIEKIMEPLQNLGIADFTFRGELKVNAFFSEAVDTYIKQERVHGLVFYNESNNSLTIISKIQGQTRDMSTGRYGNYYTILRIESRDGKINVMFSCTCPWALGHTLDRRGKPVGPEYSSMCKHGIATLFYFFPEILAYMKIAKEGTLSKDKFEEALTETRKAFMEFQKRLDAYVNRYPTYKEAVFSNVSYLMWREFFNNFSKLGNMKKFVPSMLHLNKIEKLWKSLSVKKTEVTVSSTGGEVEVIDTESIKKLYDDITKTGIYNNLKEVEELLNGLQGSRTTSLYTKALLAGLLLGSDLESDPTLVSVVGDPGTGKTLTAEGLARLIGIRTIVIEKEINRDTLAQSAINVVSQKISRYIEFFKKVVEPKIPEEHRDSAEKFFEEFLRNSITMIRARNTKKLIKTAKKFAETFVTLYGVSDKKTKIIVAKLFYEILKTHRDIYEEATSGKAIERKALEERRAILKRLSELGLLNNPDEKENINSGAVRWEVLETAKGYKVRVLVDLHYLIRRMGGNASKVAEVLKELGKIGKVHVKTEVPGLAELKLSEAEYLEKALKVREEDILSPARRLIWVGGEITKKAVILIDESRRAPELLERLLTDLSTAGRDFRRTNLVVTTDNAEPLMEAESDPRLDAFHSRVNFEVVTPSTTVAYTISETLEKISKLEREGKTPLITLDQALLLNYITKNVILPERYEKILYSTPLLLVYDFKILRPEIVIASFGKDAPKLDPLILLVPKGSVDLGNIKGDYEDSSWGVDLPPIRMMPERRFGHHVVRASKALAVIDKKLIVDEEAFISALDMVLMARVIPAGQQFPYLYLDAKRRVVETMIAKVREFIHMKNSATERLIELMGSLSPISSDTLREALEEMINNPIATALFVRFLEQMLVSENAKEFIEYSKKIPGLYKTLELVARYEKIYIL